MNQTFIKRCTLVVIALVVWGTASAEAQIQRPRRFSLGVYGFYSLDANMVNFLDLPGVPVFTPRSGGTNEPGAFKGTTTGNPGFGITMDYAVTDQLIVGLRGNYATQNTRLTTFSTYPVGRSDGTSAEAMSEYTIDAKIQNIGLEPFVMLNVWEGLNVFVGARLSFVAGTTYEQRETLITPSDGAFDLSGNRTRNLTTGGLPGAAGLTVAPFGGLSYTIAITDRFAIVPEISYSLGLMNVVTDTKWTVNSLRPALSLKYKL